MKKTFLAICAFMLTGMVMAQQANNTIEISDVDGLLAIANDLNGHYKLSKDIELTNGWTPLGVPPIGTSDAQLDNYSFNGTFDGQGHTISGLNINTNNSNVYIGLFARIGASGKVKNLNISGGTITVNTATDGYSCNIGSIAGVNHGTIDNCKSSATVTCLASGADVGGIVGENGGSIYSKGIINHCEFTGKLTNKYTEGSSNGTLGGIVGNNESFGVIQNCKSNPISITPSPVYPLLEGSKPPSGYIEGDGNGNIYDCYFFYNKNENENVCDVALEGRTLYKDGFWNTLCLPFDVISFTGTPIEGAIVKELDTDDPSDENGYTHVTGIEGSTLYLNFKDANSIKAGKPYIIKWTKPSEYDDNPDDFDISDPVFEGVTITAAEPDSVRSTDGKVTFKGIFFSKDIEGNFGDPSIIYLGSNNQTYYPSDPMSINALRAYFQLNNRYKVYVEGETPGQGESYVNAFNLNFNDESTAVFRIEAKEDQSGVVYDLSGRVVESDHLKPGIYIRGGKKFLIRK